MTDNHFLKSDHDEIKFIESDQIVETFYTYTSEEQAVRSELIKLIEAEKRAYMERIEPYVKQLANIHGTPHIVIRPKL